MSRVVCVTISDALDRAAQHEARRQGRNDGRTDGVASLMRGTLRGHLNRQGWSADKLDVPDGETHGTHDPGEPETGSGYPEGGNS